MFEDKPAVEISETDSVSEEVDRKTYTHAKVEKKKSPKHIDNETSGGKNKEKKAFKSWRALRCCLSIIPDQ